MPTHLTCPFCPAQSYPVPVDKFLEMGYGIHGYKCPAGHKFYIEEEKENKHELE